MITSRRELQEYRSRLLGQLDPNYKGSLAESIRLGNITKVRELIASNPQTINMSVLPLSINHCPNAFNILLHAGAPINIDTRNSPLHLAVQLSNVSMVESLLRKLKHTDVLAIIMVDRVLPNLYPSMKRMIISMCSERQQLSHKLHHPTTQLFTTIFEQVKSLNICLLLDKHLSLNFEQSCFQSGKWRQYINMFHT